MFHYKRKGETSSIELKLENRLIALERAIQRRYTDEDQKVYLLVI